MSLKGKILPGFSLHPWILTIIFLCTSVWRAPAETLAQEAVPAALNMTAHSTLWSLEGRRSNKTPYLVIGMADREDSPFYGLVGIAGDEATNSSAENTITRQSGPAASVIRTGKAESCRLVLFSILDSTAGVPGLTNFRANPIRARQTTERSPHLVCVKVYRLLDDRSALGYQANYLASKQRWVNTESYTHEVVQAPRPLFELEFGGWRLPVMLSGAAVSR